MKANIKVSPHFTMGEVLKTSLTGFAKAQLRHFDTQCALNASRLAHEILEPLRDIVGRPIVPTSWLRSPELNSKVGGSPTSQHCTGLAADITIPGADLWMAYEALEFAGVGQRIIYLSSKEVPKWIHVSLPDPSWKWDSRKKGWSDTSGFRQRDLVCYVDSSPKQYVALDVFQKKGVRSALV